MPAALAAAMLWRKRRRCGERHRGARLFGWRLEQVQGGRRHRLRRRRRGTHGAQIAFDHRQAIDHMAKRVVNGFERILRAAVGFRLAVADIGQFALDDLDQAGVHRGLRRRCAEIAGGVGERDKIRMLAFEMAQDVLQPFLDPSEIAGAGIAGGFEALQQIRHALFEMGKRRRIVVADGNAVEPFGQRAQRAFEIFGIIADGRRLPAFQRRGQGGNALLENGKGIAVLVGTGKLVDLGRQHLHVVGQPRQRVVGGDVGHDRAQGGDRAFELVNRRRIVVGAQDQVELGAEIADRLVVAGELFGRRQRAQRFTDFAERALDAGQHLRIAAALAGIVDAAGQRADFVLDRFDRPARHRFGDGGADFGELAAESRNRLLDMIGTLQRLDLARDLDQMPFERREIRAGRRGRRRRVRLPSAVRRAASAACSAPSAAHCAASAGASDRQVRSGARRFPRSPSQTNSGSAAARDDRPGRRRARPFRSGAACPASAPGVPGPDSKSATAAHRGARWRRSTAGRRSARHSPRHGGLRRAVGRCGLRVWKSARSAG